MLFPKNAWRALRVGFRIAFVVPFGARTDAAEIPREPPIPQNHSEQPIEVGDGAEVAIRIRDLRAQIAHHNTLYFEKAAPEIGDAEFDELKRELSRWEKSFPLVARAIPASPEIGDDRTAGFSKARHGQPMLSLEKAYTEAELRAFLARVRGRLGPLAPLNFVIEPKFDGVAISLTYENGTLIRAATRGDGREGDDVTANILALRNIPKRLRPLTAEGTRNPMPTRIEVRGEIYASQAEFLRINRGRQAAGESPFAHPRNLAAGTVKLHDAREVANRRLDLVVYGYGAISTSDARPNSQRELHAQVAAWGLPGASDRRFATTDEEVWRTIQAFGASRVRLKYPTDGVVLKVDALAAQDELGASDAAPRWAIAFKFSAERVETKLLGVTLQVGRTGVLTPVAELAPVSIGGTLIERASMYNRAEIQRRDLRIGDTVILEKAGEIVPAIVGFNPAHRTPDHRPFVFPSTCPSCQQPIVTRAQRADVFCVNRDCPAQICRRLEHFASPRAANIPGLGPATIERVVEKGWVRSVPDLYRLRREQLQTLGTNVTASSEKLLASIEASKRVELWRIVHGLGIPQVGEVTAKALARRYGSLEALATSSHEMLVRQGTSSQPSIGAATAEAVREFFDDTRNRDVVRELVSLGVTPK